MTPDLLRCSQIASKGRLPSRGRVRLQPRPWVINVTRFQCPPCDDFPAGGIRPMDPSANCSSNSLAQPGVPTNNSVLVLLSRTCIICLASRFAEPGFPGSIQFETLVMPPDDRFSPGRRPGTIASSANSHTQKTWSRGRSLDRLTDRLNTATCSRSARFSKTRRTSGMSIARRNSTHVFNMPIFAPLFTVEIGNSSQMPDAEQMTQALDSKRGRDY